MANIFPIDFEEKLTMAQDDYILFSDSEDGNKIKKAQYRNLKGEQGTPGADGSAATITVGSVTTGAAGSSATVVNSGTTSAAVLDFTIPQGVAGTPGADGNDGAAATITVGTTTTLPAGSSATVTNVGTSQDAILNFGIPKGDAGTGSGDVSGPASSTDGNLAVFDGVTGKIIKDGGAIPTGFTPSNTGTTGQVLKKTASGYEWDDAPAESNTKTFYLSSTSDLTSAQAAYNWYKAGKNPIIIYDGNTYVLHHGTNSVVFRGYVDASTSGSSSTILKYRILSFAKSGDTITSITYTTTQIQDANFLSTNVDYGTPYTPAYAGSPATKKYVDDKVTTSSTAPVSPTEGMLRYDTTNNVLKVYNGSTWVTTGGGGSGDVAVSTQSDNVLTAPLNLWLGSRSDFNNLTQDNGTLYAIFGSSTPGGWQPGANTIAYWEFDGNLNDSTSNHLNLTNDGTVSYNTTPTSLNLGSSTWLYNSSNTDTFNHDWTYNVWIYLNALPTPDTGIVFGTGGSGTRKMICCGIGTSGAIRLDFWGDDHAGTATIQAGQWYNLCWTYNYSTKTYKTYINTNIDMNASLGSQYSIDATDIRIGRFPEGVSTNGRINGKISRAILESAERSSLDLSNYFNQTKGDYGIS